MLYLIVVLMGLVEGLTEFIPVSSTGHLILAGDLLGFNDRVGKDFADFFEIFIQLGAILAVVVAYPRRFTGLLDFRDNRGFSGLRGLALLFVTTVPGGLLGLALRSKIKEHLFYANTVAIGLAVGAIWILAVEWFVRRRRLLAVREVPSRTGSRSEPVWQASMRSTGSRRRRSVSSSPLRSGRGCLAPPRRSSVA